MGTFMLRLISTQGMLPTQLLLLSFIRWPMRRQQRPPQACPQPPPVSRAHHTALCPGHAGPPTSCRPPRSSAASSEASPNTPGGVWRTSHAEQDAATKYARRRGGPNLCSVVWPTLGGSGSFAAAGGRGGCLPRNHRPGPSPSRSTPHPRRWLPTRDRLLLQFHPPPVLRHRLPSPAGPAALPGAPGHCGGRPPGCAQVRGWVQPDCSAQIWCTAAPCSEAGRLRSLPCWRRSLP